MASQYITTTFLLRRGTAAAWKKNNILLKAGEPGFETDTNKLKIGDGKTPWNDLPYQHEEAVLARDSHFDFPSVGNPSTIYKAISEKTLYQWNSKNMRYEKMSGGSIVDITLINGGNANGTA